VTGPQRLRNDELLVIRLQQSQGQVLRVLSVAESVLLCSGCRVTYGLISPSRATLNSSATSSLKSTNISSSSSNNCPFLLCSLSSHACLSNRCFHVSWRPVKDTKQTIFYCAVISSQLLSVIISARIRCVHRLSTDTRTDTSDSRRTESPVNA